MASVSALNTAIYNNMIPYIALVLMGSIIWEHLSGSQKTYQDLLTRTAYLIIFSLVGHKVLEGGVEHAMTISDSLIIKFAPKSEFLTKFAMSKEDFWEAAVHGFGDALLSPVFTIIWLLCWIAIYAVGHVYTLVFKLTYIAIPLSCLISIFPFTKDAVFGVLKSICWCIITPIVCSIVLITIGTENINTGTLAGKWNSLIQILLYAVTIFYIPGLGTMFLTSQGFQSAGEKLSGMMASSALTLGKYHLLKSASSLIGTGGKFLAVPAINKFGEKAYPYLSKFMEKMPSSAFQKPSLQRWAKAHELAQSKKTLQEGRKVFEMKKNIPSTSPATITSVAKDIKKRESDFLRVSGKDLSSVKFTIPKNNIDKSYGFVQQPRLVPKISNNEPNKWKHLNSDNLRFKSIRPQANLNNAKYPYQKPFSKIAESTSGIKKNRIGTINKFGAGPINESTSQLKFSKLSKYKNINKEPRSEA